MATVSELITKFSFIGSLKPQENFNSNLKSSIKMLAGFAVAVKAAAFGASQWAQTIFPQIDAMSKLQTQTRSSVEALQEMGYLASQSGSDMESMSSSLTALTYAIGEFAETGEGAAANTIKKLGINVKNQQGMIRDTVDVYIEMADKLSKLSESDRLLALQEIGLDESVLSTLRMTRSEIEAIKSEAREMGVFSQKDADQVTRYYTATNKLQYVLTSIQNTIAIGLAPVMTELAENFTSILKANAEWITKGLKWLGETILNVSKAITRLMPVLAGLAVAFGVLKIATMNWGAVLAVVMSPVFLISAAIVGLLLIIDDLIVAFNGGESVIAKFFDSFFGIDIQPILKNIVKYFKWAFKEITHTIKEVVKIFDDVFSAVIALFKGDFSGALSYIESASSRVIDLTLRGFKNLGKTVDKVLNGIGIDTQPIKDTYSDLSNFVSKIFNDLMDGNTESALKTLKDGFKHVGGFLEEVFTKAFNAIVDTLSSIGSKITAELEKMMPQWMKEFFGIGLSEEIKNRPASYNTEIQPGNRFDSQAAITSMAQKIANQNSTQNVNQNIDIHISGSNSQQIADKVANTISPDNSLSKNMSLRGGQ